GVSYLHRPLPPPRISAYTQLTRDGRRRWLTGVDENRLYINSFSGGPIYQVGINGGEMVQVPVAVPGILPMGADVLPDGSSLLVTSNEEGKPARTLWNVRIPDGTYRRLGYALDATFSPDRSTVLYSTPEGDIRVVRSDGTGGHKLGSAGGIANWPFWSPDGRVIRFSRGGRLWEISPNGSSLHELLPGWHGADIICCGQWTPDGSCTYSLSVSPRFGLLMSGADRFGKRAPSLSNWPPGQSNGIRRTPAGTARKSSLMVPPCVASSPASTQRPKPSNRSWEASPQRLSRSPTMASSWPMSPTRTATFGGPTSGSKPLQLTDPPMKASLPRWSPDGSQILFGDSSSGRNVMFAVPSEGGTPKRVLPDDNGEQTDPNWSPDGKKIVFCRGGGFSDSKSVLGILDISSHQVKQVPGSDGTFSPRWSPDGRFIAALTANGERALRVFDVSTQRWLELPVVEGVDFPAFSKDSGYIYFESNPEEGNPEVVRILRIPVKGGAAELVADLKDWRFTGRPGTWMGLDPDDAPLMMRDAGSKDIYALTLEEK
ncbi:MAG: PD40 domain-containing protein, partial [Acidobacteriaceae bacterium]|nr:PD40 domain-containing protein [Acidobacteriaceae bacterium]